VKMSDNRSPSLKKIGNWAYSNALCTFRMEKNRIFPLVLIAFVLIVRLHPCRSLRTGFICRLSFLRGNLWNTL
jgi:hypothetical protein